MSAALKTSRRPFRLRAPVVAEHPLQKQICDVLRLEVAPPGKVSPQGVVWWSIDHANYAGEVPGIRVGRGIVAGIQDTFILWSGRVYLVEIKTDTGELSLAQQSIMSACIAGGGRVGVVRNADEMLAFFDAWGIPRKQRIRRAA